MGGGITGAKSCTSALYPVERRFCASDEGRGKHFKRDQDAQHSMAWRVAIAKGLKDGEPARSRHARRPTAAFGSHALNAALLTLSCALSQRSCLNSANPMNCLMP